MVSLNTIKADMSMRDVVNLGSSTKKYAKQQSVPNEVLMIFAIEKRPEVGHGVGGVSIYVYIYIL